MNLKQELRSVTAVILAFMLCIGQFMCVPVYALGAAGFTGTGYCGINKDSLSYVLAVSSGNYGCSNVDKIVIKYLSTGGGILTQILNPSAVADDYECSLYIEDPSDDTGQSESTASAFELFYASPSASSVAAFGFSQSGSRYSTYFPLIESEKALESDESMLSSLFSDVTSFDDDFYSDVLKEPEKEDLFRANKVEYLHFTTEEQIKELIELSFIMSSDEADDWVLNYWILTEVNDFDASGNYTGPKLVCGSKAGDYFGLEYSGRCVAQSQYLGDTDLNYESADSITFITNQNKTYTDTMEGGASITTGQGNSSDYRPTAGKHDYALYNISASTDFSNASEFLDASGQSAGYGYNKNHVITSAASELLFRIKFDDSYGAGLSSMIAYEEGTSVVFRNTLNATINYIDACGCRTSVSVPVIAASLLDCMEAVGSTSAVYSNIEHGKINCFAQEGMSLYFTVNLLNLSTLSSISLSLNDACDPLEQIIVDSVAVYKLATDGAFSDYLYNDNVFRSYAGGMGAADDTLINMKLTPSALTAADPAVVQVWKTNESDQAIENKNTGNLSFCVSSASIDSDEISCSNTYMVTLTTDTPNGAGTQDEVYVTINYNNASGNAVSTQEFKLSDEIQSFYGENKAPVSSLIQEEIDLQVVSDQSITIEEFLKSEGLSDAQKIYLPTNIRMSSDSKTGSASSDDLYKETYAIDGSYVQHMTAGNKISFLIELDDLPDTSQITSFDFRMDDSDDAWQLYSIAIYSVQSTGERQIRYIGDQSSRNVTYRFETDRICVTSLEAVYQDIGMLIQESDTKTYTLVDNSVVSGTVTSRDYTQFYYTMPYADAIRNLRFTDHSKTYEVNVEVASNVTSGTADDGTGSNNLFYFQLEFANGTSGVVLANSQIEGDGFRAGVTETFYIETNEDLGDVKAIRIIPDDVTEDNSKLDRLCIASINVVRQEESGANKVYKFGEIGWISMEYTDSEVKANSAGRTLADMATIVQVSSYSYSTTLEFSFTYDNYSGTDPQFVGDMFMEITYINSKGQTKTKNSISLAKAMYDYSRRTPHKSVASEYTTYCSDDEFMFRGNTTDRFQVTIDDVSSITSFTLKGYPERETNLNIKEINIHQIAAAGSLKINTSNEYQIMYTSGSTILIAQTSDITNRSFPAKFNFTANSKTSYIFRFSSNQIQQLTSEAAVIEAVSRLPESSNDTINLFIYMMTGAGLTVKTPSEGGYELTTTIEYSSASTGNNYRTIVRDYSEQVADGQNVLVKNGISAKYMSLLNYMTLKAMTGSDDCEGYGALIDHVVIQHVRDNTVIATYNVALAGTDAGKKSGVTFFSASQVESEEQTQTVRLLVAADSTACAIVAEKKDVAVSISYKSTLGSSVYQSEYVFASDADVMSVDGGTLLTFVFNEANVEKINAVAISSTLEEDIIISCGTVESSGGSAASSAETLNVDGGNVMRNAQTVLSAKTPSSAQDTYRLVQFCFETMSPAEGYSSAESYRPDSNGTVPIAMNIAYKTGSETKIETIADIRQLSGSDGDFTQGGSATVSLMIKGIDKIGYIQIMPVQQQSGDAALWNLKSVSYTIDNTSYSSKQTVMFNSCIVGDEISRLASATKYNLTPVSVDVTVAGGGITTVSGGSVVLSGSAVTVSGGSVINNAVVRSASQSFNVAQNSKVDFTVALTGSVEDNPAYVYSIDRIVGGVRSTVKAETKTTAAGFFVKIPAESVSTSETYVITVSTADMPKVTTEITLVATGYTGIDEDD